MTSYAAGTVFLEVAPSFDGLQNEARRAVKRSFRGVEGDIKDSFDKVEHEVAKSGARSGEQYGTAFQKAVGKKLPAIRDSIRDLKGAVPKKEFQELNKQLERTEKLMKGTLTGPDGKKIDPRTVAAQAMARQELEQTRRTVNGLMNDMEKAGRRGPAMWNLGALREELDGIDRTIRRWQGADPRRSQADVALQARAQRENEAMDKRAADARARRAREDAVSADLMEQKRRQAELAELRRGIEQRSRLEAELRKEMDKVHAQQERDAIARRRRELAEERAAAKAAARDREKQAVQSAIAREKAEAKARQSELAAMRSAIKKRYELEDDLRKQMEKVHRGQARDAMAAYRRGLTEDAARERAQRSLNAAHAAALREDYSRRTDPFMDRTRAFGDQTRAMREVRIGVDISPEEARAEAMKAREAAQQILNDSVELDLDVNDARAVAQAAAARTAMAAEFERKALEAEVKVSRDSMAMAQGEFQAWKTRLQGDIKAKVKVDIDAAKARTDAYLRQLRAALAKEVDVRVRANLTREIAQVEAFRRSLDRAERQAHGLRRAMSRLNETGGAANAMRGFSGALLMVVSLGPLVIPVLAGITAGILGLGAAAIGALGGLGVLIAAFSGIGGAVGAMNDLAKAQRTANAGGGNKRAAAADARKAIQDARSLADAQRDLARARRDAAQSVADASQRVRDAERNVASAQQDSLAVQRALNGERAQAVRDLQDMNNALISARLAERADEFSVQEAAVHLNVVLEDDQATQREKDVAQLQYEQAVQRLKEQRIETARLAEDTAKANAAGVEGSDRVIKAKAAIVDAAEREREAEKNLADARQDFAHAQVAAAERVADAEENLARTMQDIAMRSEEADLATNELTNEVNNLRDAMNNLSPAGQRFATFLYGLKPLLDDIRFAAQEGFLPGLQQGMQKIVDTYGPRFVTFVGSVAEALGDVAIAASEMFTNPFWEDFFGYIAEMAPDLIRDLGTIGLNLLTVFAGLMKAFAPIGEIIVDNLVDITTAWAEWATTLEDNPAFQEFIDYVRETWPKVSELIGNLFELLIRALVALEPYADRLLDFFISVTDWLLAMDEDTFGKLITGIVMFITGVQIALGLIAVVSTVLTALSSVVGIVIFAIVALVGIFIYLWNTNETFRDGVKQAWQDIQDAIEPVVSWFINDVLPVLQDFYDDVTALFDNIKAGAKGVAEDDSWNTIKSVVDGLKAAFEAADTVISTVIYYWDWAFRNILGPVFQWFWAIAEPIIRLLGGMFDVAWQVISRVVNMVSQIFTYILVPAFTAMWDKVRPIIEAVGSWWEEHVTPKIESFIETFGRIWNGWLDIFRTPVRLGIEYVINKGLIGAFNWIAEKVPGMTKIDPVAIPDVLQPGGVGPGGGGGGKMQRAKDGAILDGYTPGRDVHTFYSPTGGRLDLSGGEAVLVPELTRALGADWVYGANKAARRGEGLERYLGGFAGGGIIDWLGDATDRIVKGARSAWGTLTDVITNPRGFLQDALKSGMQLIPGLSNFTGPLAEATSGIGLKAIDGMVEWVKNAFLPSSSEQTATGAAVPSGVGAGMGWRAQWDIVKSQFPGANLHSGFRPGAITATGYPSMHGKGRAIDITPSAQIFDWLAATFPNSYELIYSPMGARQLYKGKSKVFGEPTRSMHYDHIHWAMAQGGIVPKLYDQGGDIPPGLTLVANKTQRPESLVTSRFVEEVRQNMNAENGLTVDQRGSTFGSDPNEVADAVRRGRRDELALMGMYQDPGVS